MDLSSTTSTINKSKFPVYGKDIENSSVILKAQGTHQEEEEEGFEEDDLVDDEEAVKESQDINTDAVQKAQVLFGSFMQQVKHYFANIKKFFLILKQKLKFLIFCFINKSNC